MANTKPIRGEEDLDSRTISGFKPSTNVRKHRSLFPILLILVSGCTEEINPLKSNSDSSDRGSENQVEQNITVESPQSPITIIEPSKPTITSSETQNKTNSGAKIVRSPSEDTQIRSIGCWDIKLYTKGEKVYRLNQFRDLNTKESYEDLYGVGNDFEPLLSMEAKGPGKIKILSKSMPPIEFDLSAEKEKIEIFPLFRKEFLESIANNENEEIKITFVDGEKETLIDEIPVTWSNQRELYILDENLNDIVTLIETKPENENTKFSNSKDWLYAAILGLNKYNIKLIEPETQSGYLRIKTSKEMRSTKKATIYDLCVWLSSKAIESNFEIEVISVPNHCVLAVSELPTKKGIINTSNQYYIELKEILFDQTTPSVWSTQDNTEIKKRVDLAIEKGEEHINKEFQENADKMFALKVKEWENAYRILKKL